MPHEITHGCCYGRAVLAGERKSTQWLLEKWCKEVMCNSGTLDCLLNKSCVVWMHGQPLMQCCIKTFDMLVTRKPRGFQTCEVCMTCFRGGSRYKYGVRAVLSSSSCKGSKWWHGGHFILTWVSPPWISILVVLTSLQHKEGCYRGESCVGVC